MTIDDFLGKLGTVILNPLIKLLFVAALIVFLWGVLQYIRKAESEEGRTTGRNHIIWGLIGMTIMVAVYGILDMLVNTVFG